DCRGRILGVVDRGSFAAMLVATRYGSGRVQRPAAREHRQPPEELLLGSVQEVVAPGDGRFERLLALRAIPPAAGQYPQRRGEVVQQRGRGEDTYARRR